MGLLERGLHSTSISKRAELLVVWHCGRLTSTPGVSSETIPQILVGPAGLITNKGSQSSVDACLDATLPAQPISQPSLDLVQLQVKMYTIQ
jgi:hypothetical protein